MKTSFKDFLKKPIATMLAFAMTLSMVAPSGLSINKAHADPTPFYRDDLSEAILEQASSYTYGTGEDTDKSSIDIIRETFDLFYGTREGYFAYDMDGNALTKSEAEALGLTIADVTDYTTYPCHTNMQIWKDRYAAALGGNIKAIQIFVEGEGIIGPIKTIFVLQAYNPGDNAYHSLDTEFLDVDYNGNLYNSLFASNQQRPGTLFYYNGGMAMAVGKVDAIHDTYADYMFNSITEDIVDTSSASGNTTMFGETAYWAMNADVGGGYISNTTYLGDTNAGGAADSNTFDRFMPTLILTPQTPPSSHAVTVNTVGKLTDGTKPVVGDVEVSLWMDTDCTVPALDADSNPISATVSVTDGYVHFDTVPYKTVYVKVTDPHNRYADSLPGGTNYANAVNRQTSSTTIELIPNSYDVKVKVEDNYGNVLTDVASLNFEIREYDNATGSFVDTGATFNFDGEYFTGGTVTYHPDNGGLFEVAQIGVMNGYNIDTNIFDIDTKDANQAADFTFINGAKLTLIIQALGSDSNLLLNDALFEASYNGTNLTLNNNNGVASVDFDDNGVSAVIIKQIATNAANATHTGYDIPANYAVGQVHDLNYTSVDNDTGRFITEITINNDVHIIPIINGAIQVIAKDNNDNPIEGAEYTVENADGTPAVDLSGNAVENLVTDASGNATTPVLPGDSAYDFTLTAPVEGYAMPNPNGFTANLEVESEGEVINIVADVMNRQTTEINFTHEDKFGNPVRGAIYKLTLISDAYDVQSNDKIDANTLVGYYATDDNGKIQISTFGTANTISDETTNYPAVIVLTENGYNATGHALVNGTYLLEEVSVPSSYKASNFIQTINMDWVEHTENTTITDANGNIVAPYGAKLTANVATAISDINTVSYTVSVEDFNYGLDIYKYYMDSTEMVEAWENGLLNDYCAKLINNLSISVYTTVPVLNANDGSTIPADTLIGQYTIGSTGTVTVDKMNVGPYDGLPLLNSVEEPDFACYKAVLSHGNDFLFADEYIYLESNLNNTFKAQIKMGSLNVIKKDLNTNAAIPNITFIMIPTSVLIAYGADITSLNRQTMESFLQQNNFNNSVAFDKITNANGIMSHSLPYGSYVVYEVRNEFSEKYDLVEPIVVTINQENVDVPVSNNNSEFKLIINHVDENGKALNGEIFRVVFDDETFEKAVINGTAKFDNIFRYGTYSISQKNGVSGHMKAQDITLNVNKATVSATFEDGTTVEDVVKRLDENGFWEVVVTVENEQTQLSISVLDTNNDYIVGAEMRVIDGEDHVVHSWTTTDGAEVVYGLPFGNYTIRQYSAPAGYATAANVMATVDGKLQTATVVNEQTKVSVKTMDAISAQPLMDVVVEMRDADGNVVATFDNTHKTFKGIPVGSYTLHQIQTPVGYQKPAEPIAVIVKDTATEQIFLNNAVTKDNDGNTIMVDNRTYGTFSLFKKDSVDDKPLGGVEFELRLKHAVIVNGESYPAGTVVATMKTGADGKVALSEPMAIGLYDNLGYTPVKFVLVETKTPNGQYVASEPIDVEFKYDGDEKALIDLGEIVVTNDRPEIVVTQESDPMTQLVDKNGNPLENRESVTAVVNNDKITYTITVKNEGTAPAYKIEIKDVLPKSLIHVEGGNLDLTNNTVYWTIDQLNPGQEVVLTLVVQVVANGAELVYNNVSHYVPNFIPEQDYTFDKNDKNIQWIPTDKTCHQVIDFVSVGNEEELIVSAFDTVHFQYPLYSIVPLKGLSMSTKLPAGLTYTEGSAVINGVPCDDNVSYNKETNELILTVDGDWASVMEFEFDTTVDYIPAQGEKHWTTYATFHYIPNEYTGEVRELITGESKIYADAKFEIEMETDVPTYVGDVNEATNVTVLKRGDEFTITYSIKNNGASRLKLFALENMIPAGVMAIDADITSDNAVLRESVNGLIWCIQMIEPKATETITVTYVVTEQKVNLYDLFSDYDLIKSLTREGDEFIFAPFEQSAKATDSIVYQTVEFHKTGVIAGKPNTTDVKANDVITFTMKAEAEADVYGVKVVETIPAGLTYVPGTARYKLPGSVAWINCADGMVYNEATRTITFSKDNQNMNLKLTEGISEFQFSVRVDNMDKSAALNTQAKMLYKSIPTDADTVELKSEVLSYTYKVGEAPVEPQPDMFTITYTDGVENEEIFADQKHTVVKDSKTPAFNGTLVREGYTFTGWSPAIASKVTADATYTAQWEKDAEDPKPEDPKPEDPKPEEPPVEEPIEIAISATQKGSIPTYEGAYAGRNKVTVLQNGDKITFTTTVKNDDLTNAAKNVIITNAIPANTTLVKDENPEYTEKDGVLIWNIANLQAGQSVTVNYTVQVNANTACEIIGQAKCAVADSIDKVETWTSTNSVVYQVISITVTSDVPGGTTDTDAKSVEIGSVFTYNIVVECLDDIYGLKLSDVIPAGLTYVENSAKVSVNGADKTAANATYDSNTRTLSFAQFDEVKAGKLTLSFQVKVNDVEEYDKAVIFTNQAEAEFKPSADSTTTVKASSNKLTHKTIKTNATDTPKLGLETTSASIIWTIIAFVAMVGIGTFGYFGFIAPYKKRDE